MSACIKLCCVRFDTFSCQSPHFNQAVDGTTPVDGTNFLKAITAALFLCPAFSHSMFPDFNYS